MTTRLRSAFDLDTPLGAALCGPWLPFAGVGLAAVAHIDPSGTSFYETTAQVAAALLIAFAVDNASAAANHRDARWTLGLTIGIALGIIDALIASLWAIARGDGSVILAGFAVGGLFLGVVFLVSAMVRSAAVAGAFGEDLVVGGGEGGREGAEEDGVGAEG